MPLHRERAMTHSKKGVYCSPTSPPFVSSKMYRARRQAVLRILCDSKRKKDEPLWHANHTPSFIQANLLRELD
jgi:hypothetical protein